MKKIILSLLAINFTITSSVFSQEVVGTVLNRKTKEKIVVKIDENNKKLLISLIAYGIEDTIKEIKYNNISSLRLLSIGEPRNPYNMKILEFTQDLSGFFFEEIVYTVDNYFEFCSNGRFILCYLPLPSVLVVVPAVSGGLAVAGAATFLAGVISAPIDGGITLVSYLTNRDSLVHRKFKKAMDSKNVKVSDRVFEKMVYELKSLR